MLDPFFRVETLEATANPQQLCWLAMHQDYSPYAVFDKRDRAPEENRAGELVIEKCQKFGHWGVFEHPQITVNAIGFPHSMMQQLRTHRIGISFDVSSLRYTSQHILDVANYEKDIEQVFYLRPADFYTSRQGARYEYTESDRTDDFHLIYRLCRHYQDRIEEGFSEEHARGLIPFDIRQNFVVSMNARSLMHILDLRAKADAQLEIQAFCDLLLARFIDWMPQVADYYKLTRFKKARLSP